MRLAILSNVTTEVLAGLLRERHEVWLPSGFGAWMETALAPSAEMKSFEPEAIVLILDRSHASFDDTSVERALDSLKASFPGTPVIVPDLEDLADEAGSFYDERMWKLASMPWSLEGLRSIASETDRLLAMRRGGRKKVLALDLDGVLWDGVVGEDGVDGIAPRTEFQSGVKALKNEGVLLVVLSKNNADDVANAWKRPGMILKESDFVAMLTDWEPKSENLAKSAKMLNLGTDSFVFVDDNPAERAEMRARMPEVSVAEFPVTVRRLRRLYFPPVAVTAEDLGRTEMYRAEAARKGVAEGRSLDDYLKDLEIRTDVHVMRDDEIPRVAQLSRKTNQFNVSGNRYTDAEVGRFAADKSHLLVTMRVSDRFGDLGLVAFAHAANGEVVDWTMSCRAMNRKVEFALEKRLEECLRARGVETLRATWKRSPKNAPVKELFDGFGFSLESETDAERNYIKHLSTLRDGDLV